MPRERKAADLGRLLAKSLAQMRRGEGVVIACPDCSASLAHPGHAKGCPRVIGTPGGDC